MAETVLFALEASKQLDEYYFRGKALPHKFAETCRRASDKLFHEADESYSNRKVQESHLFRMLSNHLHGMMLLADKIDKKE